MLLIESIYTKLLTHPDSGKINYISIHRKMPFCFETERIEEENYQGVAVMNYTDWETPYTRSIEHKHFEFGEQPVTYVTKEYPADWHPGEEAYYPVNNERNQHLSQFRQKTPSS